MTPNQAAALRVLAALVSAAGGILVLLCGGIGMQFWTLVGVVLAVMGVAGAYFIAGRDYIAGATPAALAAVVAVFVFQPPISLGLLGVILLLCAAGLAYVLYEVD